MNKSKFLKKSLAALLAILMVAAMIPMSAFAADGDVIYVDGIQAVLEDGSYSVTLQYDQENVAAKVAAVEFTLSSLKGTTVTLLDSEGKNPLTASLSGVPGTNSAKRTISLNTAGVEAPEGKTYGEYKMVLRVQDAGADAVEYPFTITVQERAKRRNVAIAEDDGVTGDNVVSYSVTGNVITIVKAIGAPKVDMQPIITAADTASKIENVSSAKQFVDATSFTETPHKKMLKKVGVNTPDAVRVRAEDGSYQDYTIKYVTENVFESITVEGAHGEQQIGDVVYTEPNPANGVVIATFTVPYGTAGSLTPTFKASADVEGIVTANGNSRSEVASATTGGSYFYLDSETRGRRDVSGKASLNLKYVNGETDDGLQLYVSTINQSSHFDVATGDKTGLAGKGPNLILRAVERKNTEAYISDVSVANTSNAYEQDLVSLVKTTSTQNINIGDEDASVGNAHKLKFYVPAGAVVAISNWGDKNEHVVAEARNSNPDYAGVRYGAGSAATKASFTVDLKDIATVESGKTYILTIDGKTVESGATANATATDLASAFQIGDVGASADWEITDVSGSKLTITAKTAGLKSTEITTATISSGTTTPPSSAPTVTTGVVENWDAGADAVPTENGVVEFPTAVPVQNFTTTPLQVTVTSEDGSQTFQYKLTFSPKPTTAATVNSIVVTGDGEHGWWNPVKPRTVDGDDVIYLAAGEVPETIDVSVSNGATAKTLTAMLDSNGDEQDTHNTGHDPVIGEKDIEDSTSTPLSGIQYVAMSSGAGNPKGYDYMIIVHAFYGPDNSDTVDCDPKSEKVFYVKCNAPRTEELITYAHVTYSTDISDLDMNETNVFDVRNMDHNGRYIQIDVPYNFNLDNNGNTQATKLYLYENTDRTISDGASVVNAANNGIYGLSFSLLGDQTARLTNDYDSSTPPVATPADHTFANLTTAMITTQVEMNEGTFDRDANNIGVKVTSESGVAKTYKTYAVRQAASSACVLNSISSPDEKISIELDNVPGTNRYIIKVPYSYNTETYDRRKTPSFDITFDVSKNATVQDGSTTDPMKFFGPNVTSRSFAVSGGRLYYNGKLVSGDSFVVKAEDGTATTQYLFTVETLPANTDSSITSITVGGREAVAGENNTFAGTVPYGQLRQKLAIVTGSDLSKVTINDRDYEPDREYDLTNALTILVTAEDGSTSTYTLTVAESDPSTEAKLVSLKVGEANGVINADNTVVARIGEKGDLTAQVLTIEVSESATYTVDGRVYDGSAIAVNEPVEIVVTAEDGTTTTTYTLTVLAEDVSTDNTISEITVDGVTATAAENTFTAEAEDPASVILTIELPERATAAVNGVEYTPGMTIDASSPVTIIVTAEDGTTAEYTLNVTKKQGEEPTPTPSADDFSDVPAKEYYTDAVLTVFEKGIMTGKGTTEDGKTIFNPTGDITRAEMAVVICRMYGADFDSFVIGEKKFTDIPASWSWAEKAIYTAVANKWMSGTSATTFAPTEKITREEVAVILAASQKLTANNTTTLADDAKISSWAKAQVYKVITAGYMGYTNTAKTEFTPKKNITRAEVAVIVTNVLADIETPDEGEQTPDEGEQTPDEGEQTPDEGEQTPDEGEQTPDEGEQTPDEGEQTPDEGEQTPDEGEQTPDEGEQTPDEGDTTPEE